MRSVGRQGRYWTRKQDSLEYSNFMVFEMEHLLNRGDKDLIPVMLYLFDALEQRLDGRPTLILIDEAWLMMLRAKFGEKVEEWLRTLRKKNASVIFTSQSLSDVERCPQRNIIVESCQTKIFLPNAEAETAQSKALYLDMGLNDKEIQLLRFATPKKHYLYHSPLGRRLFDMNLGRAALCFVGATGREDIRQVRELAHTYGKAWPAMWLRHRGCEAEAAWWVKTHTERHGEQQHEKSFFTVPPAGGNGVIGAVSE